MIFHICNKGTPEFNGWQNISSYQDLLEIKEPIKSVWLLNASLNWNANKQSGFYGFDIAKFIRAEKKSKAPIVFYSPIPKPYFEKRSEKEIKFKILFGRGSAFLEAPFKEADLNKLAESIKPLSNAALHDVATMLCDLKGIVIDKLNHDLKFGSDVYKVINSISPYLSAYQKQSIQLNEFAEKLQQRTKSKDSNGFFTDKQQFITLCNLQLTASDTPEPDTKKCKHKVLVIDDKADELKEIVDNLSDAFEVIQVTQATKALDELKNDTGNKIFAVVADWRLYEQSNLNQWQPLQGYEILEFASKNGIRALFALTSQADFVVHHIRNLMGVRFSLLKKENLRTAEQWKVFVDVLNESCEQISQLRGTIPNDSAQWTKVLYNKNGEPLKTLQQQYIETWNSEERDSYFSKITTTANEIWNYLEKTPKNNALNLEFGVTVPTKVLELEPILIYRRIWLALWFRRTDIGKRISREMISEFSEQIYKRMFAPGITKSMSTSATSLTFKLCLEINKVQQGKFLPEEKEWLISHNLLE
jgi:hypothetical protein